LGEVDKEGVLSLDSPLSEVFEYIWSRYRQVLIKSGDLACAQFVLFSHG